MANGWWTMALRRRSQWISVEGADFTDTLKHATNIEFDSSLEKVYIRRELLKIY